MYAAMYQQHPEIRACLTDGLRFANLGGVIGSVEALNHGATWILEHCPDARCTHGGEWPNEQACLRRFVLEGLDQDSSKPHVVCGTSCLPRGM